MSQTSFKGKICVIANNISNCKMKTMSIMESQMSLNITKALFPMNLCMNNCQPENCSVNKLPGNFQMLKTAEFHDPFIAEGFEQMLSVHPISSPCPVPPHPPPQLQQYWIKQLGQNPKNMHSVISFRLFTQL